METCQIFRIVQLSGIYGNIRKRHPWAVTSDLVYSYKSLTTALYNYCIICKALDTCKSGFNMSKQRQPRCYLILRVQVRTCVYHAVTVSRFMQSTQKTWKSYVSFTAASCLHNLYRTPQALHADTLSLFLETVGSKLTSAEAYVQLGCSSNTNPQCTCGNLSGGILHNALTSSGVGSCFVILWTALRCTCTPGCVSEKSISEAGAFAESSCGLLTVLASLCQPLSIHARESR